PVPSGLIKLAVKKSSKASLKSSPEPFKATLDCERAGC
ncbi:MAG: hypothetical protein ACI9XB_003257, partial [Gammaproteobacteria bacterium]